MALIRDYLNKTESLQSEFGRKSVVLMQVGAFFEVYGSKKPSDTSFLDSNIESFSKICELAVTKKQVCVGQNDVYMSGFRDYMLDKYLRKLQLAGYTTAVYEQDEKAAGSTRSLQGIYSPGTYFPSDNSGDLTNNVACVWLQKSRNNKMVIAISNIDVFTGQSLIFEFETEYTDSPIGYDELERFISIHTPNEIIILHNLDNDLVKKIINYASINTECLHLVNSDLDENPSLFKKAKNCEKQTYIVEVLTRFFNESYYHNSQHFCQYPLACQSYCFLLDFISTHNPNLVQKISEPTFENFTDRVVLANHSLKQLNVLKCSNTTNGKNSSLCSFLNVSITPMGSRRIKHLITHPTTNSSELQREYDTCEHVINSSGNQIDLLRSKLSQLKDVERLTRKIALKKITPEDIYNLCENLVIIDSIYNELVKDPILTDYINSNNDDVRGLCGKCASVITTTLNLTECSQTPHLDFEANLIRKGINNEHDAKVKLWMNISDMLEAVRSFLDSKVASYEKNKQGNQVVKIHETDKHGFSLICTKRRSAILLSELSKIKGTTAHIPYYSKFDESDATYEFDHSEIESISTTTNSQTLVNAQIKQICESIVTSKYEMRESSKSLYYEVVDRLITVIPEFQKIVSFVSLVDVLYSKAFLAKKYKYCKPEIRTDTVSFVNANGIRHPLIENLIQDEIYVRNDLSFDAENRGYLLYGTNAVGKSSLIKAIGLAIIMAQAGFYVPCSTFIYSPYSHIFTRILGNDDIFKGLSTFAVEMLELKTILTMANENSLILGDELCSGTENDSAISIFVAGLQHLDEAKSSFIFATHFHEVAHFEEIEQMHRIKLKHLAVQYNIQTDTLVYDRQLQDGPGESMYGLEVCKSLHLPKKFLQNAHAIRNKYKSGGSVLEMKTSHYNSKKLVGTCEMCKTKMSSEVHHLQHQKHADDDGYIQHFHKNHSANLISVCEKCHLELHRSNHQHVRIKTTNACILKEI